MKRGGQVLAGILNDFSEVERAMSEIEQSAGSADKEMEIIEESLDYKINALKETWTGIFQNLIDRGTIGGIIDFLTTLSELIEKVTENSTALSVAFSAVLGTLAQFKFGKDFNWIDTFKSIGESVIGAGKGSVISSSLFSSIEIPDLDKLIESQELDNQISELEDKLDGFFERVSETMSEAFTETFTDTDGIEEATEEYMATLNEKLEALREEQATDESSLVTLKEKQAALTEEIALEKGVREAVTEKDVAQNQANQTLMQTVMTERGLSLEEKELMMAETQRLSVLAAENTEEAKAIIKKGEEATEEEQLRLAIIRETASRYALTDARMADVAAMIKTKIARGVDVTQTEREIVATYEHITALKQEQVQAGLTSKALTILKSVGSMLVTSAIIFGITKVIGLLDDWIHREEKLAEAAKKARDEISNIDKKLKENIATTNDIKQRYAELAQGVANLGTAFQSQGNLSTDEYKEFLDLSNQLAELYPSLTQGYTDNKDAILNLSGSVDTIVGSLDKLIDRSKTLARMEIDEQMETVWGDNTNQIEKLQDELKGQADYYGDRRGGLEDRLEVYKNLYEYVNSHPLQSINAEILDSMSTNLNANTVRFMLAPILEEVDRTTYNEIFNKRLNDTGISNFGVFGPDGLEKISALLQKEVNDYQNQVDLASDKIKQINAEMQSQLISYLSGDLSYAKLDKDKQLVVNSILSNFDMTNLPAYVDNWDELTDWYHTNIINAIDKIDDKDIQENLAKLFSGEGTYSEAQNLYKTIYDYLINEKGFLPNDPLILYLRTEIEGQEQIINNAVKKLTNNVEVNRKASYGKFWTDWLSEQTDEFVSWVQNDLSIPDNVIYTTQELLDLYDEWINKEKEIIENNPATISESIKQLATQVDPYFDEIDNFYQKIFDIVDGNTIQNDNFNPTNFAKLDNDTLNSLRSTFEEISEEVGVAFDPSIVDNFWHELEKATTSKEAHAAIDSLVTQWLDATDTIKNINDDTANYVKVQLSNWGIINADEVVQSRLELNNADKEAAEIMKEITPLYEELRQEKENLTSVNIGEREQAKARIPLIEQEIIDRYKEVEATEATKIALFNLAVVEAGISLNHINSATDVQQILAIANACGITSNALTALQTFEQNIAKLGGNGMGSDAIQGMRQQYINQFQQDLDPSKLLKDAQKDLTEAAKDAGGGAGKETVDAFQNELDVLKWLYDNDVIDYKHYLDQKKVLLDRALAEGLIDNKRYFEEIHTWLRETLELYNSVISYASKLLDKEIDRLEKERDERIKSIEEQRDAELKAIDDEIEAQEKKIKAKQKEIDELQKANEARKQAIDLQKAEYELQRSLNQRTNLVEILCQAS